MFGAPPSTRADELLPWSWAVDRLAGARNFWLTTVRPWCVPNARPVWGIWGEVGFSFSTGGRAARDLAANPACTVHLEDGWECVIVEGRADIITDPEVRETFCVAYNNKYDWSLHLTEAGVGDDEGADGPMFLVRPERAYGWPGNIARATRWRW
jgi:hypothetical protein